MNRFTRFFEPLVIALLLLPKTVLADAPAHVVWSELAPSTAPYEDPFLEMSYWQKDDLRTILQATQNEDDNELAQRSQVARARLFDDGYDADALLEQRLFVMEKRREEATGVTGQFLGQVVTLDGYVLPLSSQDGRVYTFLLVPWVGACIHTPSPPPNQMVRVTVPDGIEIDEVFHAVRLRGVLEHEPTVSNLFLVDGHSLVEASYTLNSAQIWGEPEAVTISSTTQVEGNLVTRAQLWISNLFTNAMTSIDQGRSLSSFAFALTVAFLYGVLHTLGPGHGKAVVISYFAGEGGSLRRGIGMGIKISIVHVFSAVVAVCVFDLAIRQVTGAPPSDYRLIRLASYALIIAIGVWMVWTSLAAMRLQRGTHASNKHSASEHAHVHSHEHQNGCAACAAAQKASSRKDSWLATAVGIVPCTGALLVMLYGLANDLLLPAITMVVAISLGMAISMSLIGIAAIWSRAEIERRARSNSKFRFRLESIMRFGGAACVLAVGLFLFTSTWMATPKLPSSYFDAAAEKDGTTLSELVD